MMKLDHIVHFTGAAPEESVHYWNDLGFHAVIGGSHKNWGTRNALMYGSDYYVEWLAVEEVQVVEHSSHPLIENLRYDHRGFGTVCLRSENLAELATELEARGFQTTGVMDAERQTEAGDVIRWKMLFIEQTISEALPLPFFIEWEEPDADRFAGLKKKGSILESNERLQLDRLVFSVQDPEQSELVWKQMLGGKLELGNCRFVFRNGTGRERLAEVQFAGAERTVEFEQGVYQVPRFE